MTNYYTIAFALFLISGYLIFIYEKLESLEHASANDSTKETSFPQSDFFLVTTSQRTFRGFIILRAFADAGFPMLIAKGYIGDEPCYIYIEGKDSFASLKWEEIEPDDHLKKLQVSSRNIYIVMPEEEPDIFRPEDPLAMEEFQNLIEGSQKIHRKMHNDELEMKQTYQYDFQTKQIHKESFLHKIATLPLRWSEHLVSNNLTWGVLLVSIFATFGSIYFFEVPTSLRRQNMIMSSKELIVAIIYGSNLTYFLLYYLFQRKWIRTLLYAPYIAVPTSFLTAPVVFALFASIFELDKKPFHAEVVALQQYSIRFVYQSHTKHGGRYQPEYRLSYLRFYNSNRAWPYSKNLTIKEPSVPFPPESEKRLFETTRKQLLQIQENQGITRCRNGCGFISPCNRLSLVALDGAESLGFVTLQSQRILRSESICDTLPASTYEKLYAPQIQRNDEIGIMVVPKNDPHFSTGKRFAQMIGTGLAFDRKRFVLEVDPYKSTKEMEENFHELFPKNISAYHPEMQALKISERNFISVHSFYLLDKEMLVDWHQVDKEKYKVIRIQKIGKSEDGNLTYYLVVASMTPYWPYHWYYRKNDPYFDAILATW